MKSPGLKWRRQLAYGLIVKRHREGLSPEEVRELLIHQKLIRFDRLLSEARSLIKSKYQKPRTRKEIS